MTTLAEKKTEHAQKIKDLQLWMKSLRVKVIEALELAEELRDNSGGGLLVDYNGICTLFAEQRAFLRGLTTGDVLKFNLPSTSSVTALSAITLPKINGDTTATFGYLFYDTAGILSVIGDPTLYYLAKKKTGTPTNFLSTFDDMDAYLAPVSLLGSLQDFAIGNNNLTNFNFTLLSTPVIGTVKIFLDGVEVGVDDGAGNITGGTLTSGTIDYVTGNVSLVFNTAPGLKLSLKAGYDGYRDKDKFDIDWDQVDFTLSSLTYGPTNNLTLDLINIGAGILDSSPKILDQMILRRKDNHQQMGTIEVTCEGLGLNDSWNHLIDPPEEMTLLNHADFSGMLGFVDITGTDALAKSANPYNTSSSKKVGTAYPDIEKNPFWPATDGTYQDDPPFTGNVVHLEDDPAPDTPKWSVHNDIKWVYGTKPTLLGDTAQGDPQTVTGAMTAITGFTSVNPVVIPDDGTSGTASYSTYALNSGIVEESFFEWDATLNAGAGGYKGTKFTEFTCYYNDVVNLRIDHLDNLKAQLLLITNIVDPITPGNDAASTTFYNACVALISLITDVIDYHNAFTPCTPTTTRPTYVTTDMATLIAAATLDVSARITAITAIIGADHTAGYAQIIYDSCSMATHRSVGYIRGALKEVNTLLDVYEVALKKQQDYAIYP